jgi:L-seryl-tRNA(Ser) seleniumtransferase
MSIYSTFGVNRVVNASFALTRLGGSSLCEEVLMAMKEANKNYCNLWDLTKRAGEIIAEPNGAEAAWITPGAFSALVLSVAACMVGIDPEKMRKLPNTKDMRNEFIIQRANRLYVYDRSIEVAGGNFVFVGDEIWGCPSESLENAINENTAAIHYAITSELKPGVLSIEETVDIAHDHGIPVILDAAGKTWPLEGLRKYTDIGVDLVCYGGKYVGGPNSTGWVQGRKDLVESIALQSFIGAEAGPEEKSGFYRSIGRGYKLDRQEIVGLIVAFRRWLKMDHEKERFEPAWEKVHFIEDHIMGLKKLQEARFRYHPSNGEGCGYHLVGLEIHFDEKTSIKGREEVRKMVYKLREENPEIWVRYWWNNNYFIINTLNLVDGEEKLLVERFKKIFG